MGGSGGQSSNTTFSPPSYTTDAWKQYVNQGVQQSQTPYQGYQGQTIAGLSPEQQSGFDLTTQVATNSTPDVLAMRNNLTNTASGNYLQGAGANPFSSRGYTDAVINDNANNMASAYRTGTAAQTDAAAGLNGAFGGSAYRQQVAGNEGAFANSVGQMANQYRLQNAQLGSQNFENERNRMVSASGLAPQMQGMDLQAGQALTGVGDAYRQYNQDLLNQGQSAWNQQQLYPYQQLDNLGNVLARASGNVAGGSTATSTNNYQASPFASLLGLGATGYGLYSAFK